MLIARIASRDDGDETSMYSFNTQEIRPSRMIECLLVTHTTSTGGVQQEAVRLNFGVH